MTDVVGVKFKEVGKMYYFAPGDNKLSIGDNVIVETARGLERYAERRPVLMNRNWWLRSRT